MRQEALVDKLERVLTGDQSQLGNHRRLLPLDALRGLIICLMALDHANYFIAQRHPTGEHWGGSFPSYDSAISFLTRLVTHLCAPGFFFLMGAGIILYTTSRRAKGWSWAQIRRHLILRGVILILLQFAVVNPIWKISSIPFPRWYQGVLVALGGTLSISIFFLRVKPWQLLTASLVLLASLELTYPAPEQWGLLFDQPLGIVLGYSGGNQNYWVNYPILPWFDLVLLGMAFGRWFERDPQEAYRRGLLLGAILLLAFIPLRALNGFGNIRPVPGNSWIDFFNVVKYPPSMTFLFLTMGFNLTLLFALHRLRFKLAGFVNLLIVYGQVPLFIYISHLLLYALLGRWLAPEGTTYAWTYLLWMIGLVVLFPLAKYYRVLKRQPGFRPILQFF